MIDDVVEGFEDPVGEPILPHEPIVEDDGEVISRKVTRLDYICALADHQIYRWVILAFAPV